MISNEIKVGTTILLAIIVAVIGFRTMRDIPFFKDKIEVVSVFNKVDGLTAGKSVFINGVDIGTIKKVELSKGDSVRVIMSIDGEVAIPINSKAYIRSLDLIGSKAIVIEKGNAVQAIQAGGTIKGVFDEGAFSELQEKGITFGDKVVQTTDNVNKLVDSLSLVLSRDLRQNLKNSMANLDGITARLDRVLKQRESEISSSIVHLEQFLANSDTLSASVKANIEDILASLKNNSKEISSLTTELNALSGEARVTLQKLNEGEGTMGKLLNDPSLYNNLDSLTFNLQRFMRNMDKDPERYLKHVRIRLF